jgi:L-iditol 2-dehydrogenase
MDKQMRVAMYYNNNDIRIEKMAVPDIGPGEMLLKIKASGICGSDVLEWYRVPKAPRVLGHEVAGEIVEAGEGVDKFRPGDRVVAAHHVPCNTCYYCANGLETACKTLHSTNFDPGGFAEYVRLPRINTDRGVFLIPGEVSYRDATFVEPLACVLRGQELAGLRPGQSVLVLGCGIAGLLHIKLARALGAGRIAATDINERRLELAKKFGAENVFTAADYNSSLLREINDGRLADLVIVCAGAKSAYEQALSSVEQGGCVLCFAPSDPGASLEIKLDELFWNQSRILSTYAASPANHLAAMELIRAGRVRVSDMITHNLGLAETARGFDLVAKAEDSLKVIIEPEK